MLGEVRARISTAGAEGAKSAREAHMQRTNRWDLRVQLTQTIGRIVVVAMVLFFGPEPSLTEPVRLLELVLEA